MKKYLLPIIASFLVGFSVYAFKEATLYTETWEGIKKIIVTSQDEANILFDQGYKLYDGELLGTSITTINGSDTLKDSRTTINDNFTALNNGKIEVSTTTLPLITTLLGLTSIGTITSGTWNGTGIDVARQGTGTTSPATNHIMLGNGASGFKTVSGLGNSGQLLTSQGAGSAPIWDSPSVDTTIDYSWTGNHTFNATTTFQDYATSTGMRIIKSLTAGTTLTGQTTPQPVYIASSTGKVLLSDANASSTFAVDFVGFAIQNAVDTAAVLVQTAGVVSGFSALTTGAEYFVQDAVGTIGTTMGTYPLMIGRAVSANQLLIQREVRTGSSIAMGASNGTYYAPTDGFIVLNVGSSNVDAFANCTVSDDYSSSQNSFSDGTFDPEATATCMIKKGKTYTTQMTGTSKTHVFVPIN